MRVGSCPGDTAPPIRFRTIRRSTWKPLPACPQGEYEPLSSLSPEMRGEWVTSMKLDRPGEGRNEFFEVIVQRMGYIAKDPNVAADAMAEPIRRMGKEGLRYLESQVASVVLQDQAGGD